MTKPIKPDEVQNELQDEVVEVFNDLIRKYWDGEEAVVSQNEAVQAIVDKLEINRSEIFTRHMLDVEHVYRKAGWKVEYDKPGYNETYKAYFRFRKGDL